MNKHKVYKYGIFKKDTLFGPTATVWAINSKIAFEIYRSLRSTIDDSNYYVKRLQDV